jgi:hypothetical protein
MSKELCVQMHNNDFHQTIVPILIAKHCKYNFHSKIEA